VGISIGHKDTDNLFVENTVTGNARYGVLFRDEAGPMAGHRNRFLRCTIQGNGGDDPEGAEVQVEGETRGVVFEDCAVGAGAAGAAPPAGVAVGPRAEAPRFVP
jgi:hypothetical protein